MLTEWIFGWKEVYLGYSLEKYNKVVDILINNDIKYNTDVKNQDSGAIGRGSTRGSMPMSDLNMQYSRMYSVMVKKKDYDKALYLINRN